jgi:hypothetical protein
VAKHEVHIAVVLIGMLCLYLVTSVNTLFTHSIYKNHLIIICVINIFIEIVTTMKRSNRDHSKVRVL